MEREKIRELVYALGADPLATEELISCALCYNEVLELVLEGLLNSRDLPRKAKKKEKNYWFSVLTRHTFEPLLEMATRAGVKTSVKLRKHRGYWELK